MREAIDYSALNWIRQELGESIKQARLQLEEYAADPASEISLQRCATQLHEVIGPLKMVDIKGAVLLTTEMEEVIADLQQGMLEHPESALELLMQGFLRLPDYLSSIRSGSHDNPTAVLELVNSLRATRGAHPLLQTDVFSPNLSARVPTSVFDVRAEHVEVDVPSMARAARVRFQSGLLEWYRDVKGNEGLQALIDVLEHLQQCATSEPAARVWWVGAGVAEALRDGLLETTSEAKQLFGQLDRQIKRLMDAGEAVFDDALSDELMKNLLFRVAQTTTESEKIRSIRETYGIEQGSGNCDEKDAANNGQIAYSEEMLEAVAESVYSDISHIKEQLDNYNNRDSEDTEYFMRVANDLHALANTLGMVSKDAHADVVAGLEQALREMVSSNSPPDDSWFVQVANALVSVEDSFGNADAWNTEGAVFQEGLNAVTREIVACMVMAKDAISEYIKSSDDFEPLSTVPGLLNQVCGSLRVAGQERAAVAADQVKQFIAHELIEQHQPLYEDQLDLLADAICSIEFHVEEIAENHSNTGAALDVAEQSLEKLGYPCPTVDKLIDTSNIEPGVHETAAQVMDCVNPPEGGQKNNNVEKSQDDAVVDQLADIYSLQVVAPDADEEILAIFIEEAYEELQKLATLLPIWTASTEAKDYLVDIRRSYHTLKGSGRMVGALAVGEFAWAIEYLANKVIDETVEPHDDIKSILTDSVAALGQLLAQVKDGASVIDMDINGLARRALLYSTPGAALDEDVSDKADDPAVEILTGADSEEQSIETGNETCISAAEESQDFMALPVLSAEADPEIVEIFLEEATEEIPGMADAIAEWIEHSDNVDALARIRRCLHTLKGSGRMAGAMIVGELSWHLEDLLNKVIEGTVPASDDLRALLVNVPEALSQLVAQVQGGTEPVVDAASMMLHANAIGRGVISTYEAVDAVIDTTDVAGVTDVADELCTDGARPDDTGNEVSLLDIFGTECMDHLRAIEEYINGNAEPPVVSEALYRALHTLSGISESAEVISIRELAGNLNDYFDEYYHAQQPVSQDAINVLQACYAEISGAVQRLPELTFDEMNQQELLEQIAALPRIEVLNAKDDVTSSVQEMHAAEVADVEATTAEQPDPFSDMDQELYEIFVEEASEIIDSSEAVLRAWSDQPRNSEYMTEFQRQLHTIKGGARMVDIQAIGDLSHVLESLMSRIADGVIATSEEMFVLMQESQDRLSEMLEQVKARQMPAAATQLEARLNALWQTEDLTAACDEREEDSEPCGVDACEADAGAAGEVLQETIQAEEPVAVDAESAEPRDAGAAEEVLQDTVQEEVPVAVEAESAEPRDAGAAKEVLQETVQEEEPVAIEVESAEPRDAGSEETTCSTEPVQDVDVVPELPAHAHLAFPQKRERQKQAHAHGEQVRVQSTLLDEMVNYAGEINIYRSRMEQQVSDYRYNLAELDQTITRLRDQLRQLEMEVEAQILYRYEQEVDVSNIDFDPLEMDRYSNLQQSSRSLIESISDLRSLQDLMENTTRESETLLLQQSRVSTDLQEGLLRSRMIPFAGLASRLRRIVRQSARQLGKKVDLELLGADGEMDRTVIDRVIAPLEHMLRNAVAHGVELPDQRKAAGKQEEGLITITFDREGPEIVLCIEDDGAGINTEAVRARAIERGLMAEDSQLSDFDVMQFILQTGFSTAAEVTQISGRGVGLDVVSSEVKQLGGLLHIESTAGQGTRFTVRLPYTLAINQVLLVMAGSETFCVPLASVEGVVRANCDELAVCYRTDECLYQYAGNEYQLKHLGTLLNTSVVAPVGSQKQVPVLLVRIGEKRIAIQIEALLGSREIVIKPVGAQLSKVGCISGATILGDGRVVMLLDMAAVARMNVRARMPEAPIVSDQESRLVVMVVDDSITVRKVTSRLLERNGFRILTAKDGVDAMGQLQEVVPDMMLLDIEMPRMDGFELATHMRNDTRLKHVPIIMITSRTGDKHRERAQQIGVNNYLGKPYQESDLLDSIYSIIGVSSAGAIA